MMRDKNEVIEFVNENDIKFIRMQYCDIMGHSKNVAVVDSMLENAFDNGVSFDNFSKKSFLSDTGEELYLHPQAKTFRILPWRPQQGGVARLLCDIRHADGTPFEGDSRNLLRETINRAKKEGYTFEIGIDSEFFLFETNENGEPMFNKPIDNAGYGDLSPYDKGENIRRDICLMLEKMEYNIETSHHESAHGQHEIGFRGASALHAIDDFLTFKMAVKTVAQSDGFFASFMPKPSHKDAGSGMSLKIEIYKNGERITEAKSMSDDAKSFAEGVLRRLADFSVITNSSVNSYKRLIDRENAPAMIGWSSVSSLAALKIPAPDSRFDGIMLRSPDASCNPYLALTMIIEAGMDGIRSGAKLRKSIEESGEAEYLPMSLESALARFENDEFSRNILGDYIYRRFLRIEKNSWEEYSRLIHEWEYSSHILNF